MFSKSSRQVAAKWIDRPWPAGSEMDAGRAKAKQQSSEAFSCCAVHPLGRRVNRDERGRAGETKRRGDRSPLQASGLGSKLQVLYQRPRLNARYASISSIWVAASPFPKPGQSAQSLAKSSK